MLFRQNGRRTKNFVRQLSKMVKKCPMSNCYFRPCRCLLIISDPFGLILGNSVYYDVHVHVCECMLVHVYVCIQVPMICD